MANEDHCGVCVVNTDAKNDIKPSDSFINNKEDK